MRITYASPLGVAMVVQFTLSGGVMDMDDLDDEFRKVTREGDMSCERCTSSRSDLMTLRVQFNSRHASVPSFLFRDSFLSALTIHVAQHSSGTSRHGVKKKGDIELSITHSRLRASDANSDEDLIVHAGDVRCVSKGGGVCCGQISDDLPSDERPH